MVRGGHRTTHRARDFSCYAQGRTTAPTGFEPVRKDEAHRRAGLDGENGARTGVPPGIPGGAMCVQRFDDSLNSAIHITYRISLRSSSLPEPRDPLLKVLFNLTCSQTAVYKGLADSGRRGPLREQRVSPPGAESGPRLRRVGLEARGLYPVMILPQVHLRKPCYDFYFL
jgi:hypothetical protein